MVFLNEIFGDKLTRVVCWTLIHSLWEGVIFACLAAVVIISTQRSTAKLRYNLLCILLVGFVCAAVFTFCQESGNLEAHSRIAFNGQLQGPGVAAEKQGREPGNVQAGTGQTTLLFRFATYCNEHASWIVALWFILFLIKLARAGSNLFYIQRIRRRDICLPPTAWQERLLELSKRVGVHGPIVFLQSALVKVPVVVGFIKPALLVPIGMLSNLPPGEVEAILLHELAHIRRKDYFVNLLQSLVETIFFFNPGILWISALLRDEREHCCDDIAIGSIDNKHQFLSALVGFQEYMLRESQLQYAVGFAHRKKQLLNRVKRIVYNENQKLNAMEKGIFATCIVAISLFGLASITRNSNHTGRREPNPLVRDTIPSNRNLAESGRIPVPTDFSSVTSSTTIEKGQHVKTIAAVAKEGTHYKLLERDEQPIDLYINDKKIANGEMPKYQGIIAKLEEAVENRESYLVGKLKDKSLQDENTRELDEERSKLLQQLSELDEKRTKLGLEEDPELKDKELKEMELKAKLDQPLLELNIKNSEDLLAEMKGAGITLDSLTMKINPDGLTMKKGLFDDQENLSKKDILDEFQKSAPHQDNVLYLENKLDAMRDFSGLEQQKNLNVTVEPIIFDLIEQDIIPKAADDFSFELNRKELIVNGVRQSKTIQESFIKKYIHNDADSFKFSKKKGHTSATINVN